MNHPSAELIELCGAVRDEIATPDQLARLEALLTDDAEARRFYRRFTQVSAWLERYEQAPSAIPRNVPGKIERPQRRNFALASPWFALAAFLIVLSGVTVFLNIRTARSDPLPFSFPTSSPAPLGYIQEAHDGLLIPRVGAPAPLRNLVELREGDIVTTSAKGSAVVRFADEQTLFILSADTRAWLSREGDSKIVHLTTGQLYCDVAKQTEAAQWRILTSDGEARVLGTRLAISARDDGTRVAVTSGRVRVIARDSRQTVEARAGYAAQLTPVTATITRLPPTAPTRVSSFTLVHPDTNQSIEGFESLTDGAVLDLAKLPTRKLNIRANCEPQLVGAVRFALTGNDASGTPLKLVAPLAHSFPNQIEVYYPYMLAGDPSVLGERLPERSYAWEPPVGRYTLTAVPYGVMKDAGARGEKLTVQFEVVDSAVGAN
jgi:ferric-dicitrate binding protein FerR (iron transport regulator)